MRGLRRWFRHMLCRVLSAQDEHIAPQPELVSVLDQPGAPCGLCTPAPPGTISVSTELSAALLASLERRHDDAHALVSMIPPDELHDAVIDLLRQVERAFGPELDRMQVEVRRYLNELLLLAASKEEA